MNLKVLMSLHGKAALNHISREKEHAQLTADVSVKFLRWVIDEWQHDDNNQIEGAENLFDYFINNIYKPE